MFIFAAQKSTKKTFKVQDAMYEDLEDDGEVYESIEEIWPDYPSKEDFFFNEEEY